MERSVIKKHGVYAKIFFPGHVQSLLYEYVDKNKIRSLNYKSERKSVIYYIHFYGWSRFAFCDLLHGL